MLMFYSSIICNGTVDVAQVDVIVFLIVCCVNHVCVCACVIAIKYYTVEVASKQTLF